MYNGEEGSEGYELLRFLNAIMYPHRDDFTVSEYIDFSENEELWKETNRMSGLGQSILEEGIEQGIEQGMEQKEKEIILRKHAKGISVEKIADFLEIPIEKVNVVISEGQSR